MLVDVIVVLLLLLLLLSMLLLCDGLVAVVAAVVAVDVVRLNVDHVVVARSSMLGSGSENWMERTP